MLNYDRNSEIPSFGQFIGGKFGKILLVSCLGVAAIGTFFSVHRIVTEPGHETVLNEKPYFFGHGGVQKETQKPGTGWYWSSTEGITFPSTGFKVDEIFDDLSTKTSFIDFNSYIKLKISGPSRLLSEFGTDWYNNSLKEQYRTIVRDAVKDYNMEDILSSAPISAAIEKDIRTKMESLIKEVKLPVILEDVSLGRGRPNPSVVDEMNNTAAQQQKKKTETERAAAEINRKAAETNRADADLAYQNKMGLNPDQFVKLAAIKAWQEACTHANATCIVGDIGGMAVSPKSK